MNTFGKNIGLTVSGTRHGPCVSLTLDGLPAGEELDAHAAWREAFRKTEGMSEMGVDPAAGEAPAVLCGLDDGHTTGEPLTAVLCGREDPERDHPWPRPGHGDLAALAKYGAADFSGGAFSGRLAAAVAFVGALCAQLLARRGVTVAARLAAVGEAAGRELTLDMKKELLNARGTGDSVGSVLECTCAGVPAGLGSPAFDGIESRMAALLFALPGVKAVEFGLGFGLARMRGSEANDAIVPGPDGPVCATNFAGGAEAGLTTGQPLVVRVGLRPAPDIGREQHTADLEENAVRTVRFRGKHDPCMGPRLQTAVEGAAAFCLLDAFMDADNHGGKR